MKPLILGLTKINFTTNTFPIVQFYGINFTNIQTIQVYNLSGITFNIIKESLQDNFFEAVAVVALPNGYTPVYATGYVTVVNNLGEESNTVPINITKTTDLITTQDLIYNTLLGLANNPLLTSPPFKNADGTDQYPDPATGKNYVLSTIRDYAGFAPDPGLTLSVYPYSTRENKLLPAITTNTGTYYKDYTLAGNKTLGQCKEITMLVIELRLTGPALDNQTTITTASGKVTQKLDTYEGVIRAYTELIRRILQYDLFGINNLAKATTLIKVDYKSSSPFTDSGIYFHLVEMYWEVELFKTNYYAYTVPATTIDIQYSLDDIYPSTLPANSIITITQLATTIPLPSQWLPGNTTQYNSSFTFIYTIGDPGLAGAFTSVNITCPDNTGYLLYYDNSGLLINKTITTG